MGGYFQMVTHSIEAQNLIQRYVDQELEIELDEYQDSNFKSYLMRCLEISYSNEYREQITRALDQNPK